MILCLRFLGLSRFWIRWIRVGVKFMSLFRLCFVAVFVCVFVGVENNRTYTILELK